eukprot:CAMPEP_0198241692 /NCGR_PEP_ID=MMETSP1446-20131203/6450_1 /TAXON_ID=1461542 ORGANISM="Unidentified sp, Strain CCMP2111" /NCGR_SAMPLE_ID=MMETSP1446 /ASSEMBLY_ACC=CAM_ASM_001112 /LENGTH=254 /DNA_ID=CAMNT_0043924569 /DNA_START=38 /DNA_END=799 /DNA_ORIENTATION=+
MADRGRSWRIVPMAEWHCEGVQDLQDACYPTLAASEKVQKHHALSLLERFPQGQHVAVITAGDGQREETVVGMDATIMLSGFQFGKDESESERNRKVQHDHNERISGDNGGTGGAASDEDELAVSTSRHQHTFNEITGGMFGTTHDPDGDVIYGVDISVHPQCRRMGIGRALYESRKSVAREMNCKGIVAGGLISGYHRHKDALGPEEYVARVVRGEITDPTVTFQLSCGFQVKGILRDYIDDTSCGNHAALIW